MQINETIYFQVADLVFKVVSDLPFLIPEGNSHDFRCEEKHADYELCFVKTSSIPAVTGKTDFVADVLLGHELRNEKNERFRGFVSKDWFYDAMLKRDGKKSWLYWLGAEQMVERFASGFDVMNFWALEYLLLENDALILHSSHVCMDEKALVFSAPSGTGKSTQAELWKEHASAQIVNGDKTILRQKDGVWHAYGCPMCGTSGIHKQGNEPIHAIVMLSQGTENTVRRLTPGEAFQRMYPEITVPKWNREFVLRAMELLDSVMANVPIYAFSCTKDESAVMALREAIGL